MKKRVTLFLVPMPVMAMLVLYVDAADSFVSKC
jgi:hypothetical protein